MNVNNINQMHGSIVNLLQQSRLKEAQTQAEALVNLCSYWTLTNQLEQNRTSYNYMLDYMRQGISDPQRENLYLRLRTDLWEIADRARILLLDKVSSHYYHETRRTQALLPPEPNLTCADDMKLHRAVYSSTSGQATRGPTNRWIKPTCG